MTDHLVISSKATPFPWAAVAIASSMGKTDLVFDDKIETPTLQSGDSKITGEENIVLSLANSGGISDDSSKAC
jgi:glutamyl-tRNA synthetase